MKHISHTIRQTTLLSYHHPINQPKFGRQALTIFNFLREKSPEGFTRNELSTLLNIRINSVCGRVKELLEAKWLIEIEKQRIDEYSQMKNNVIYWKEKNAN